MGILKFIGKRVLNLIPVLFIVSMIIFGILDAMPGDAVDSYLGASSNVTAEQREQIREELGLNGNIVERYGKWVGRMVQGDLGKSLKFRKPVTTIIGTYVWNTFLLNAVSLVLAIILAIPIGIRSATKRYGVFDNFWTVFSLGGISIPSFFFSLVLIYFIGLTFNLPLSGMKTIGIYPNKFAEILDIAKHMIMPVTVLAFSSFSSLVRYVRNSMIDVINQDYIRTARAKGLKEKVVIYHHAFRNALIPLVTLLGLYIPTLFSGAVITETVFKWPGLGNVLLDSIVNRDNSIVLASLLLVTLMLLLGNLLSDVLYAVVDPRIRVE